MSTDFILSRNSQLVQEMIKDSRKTLRIVAFRFFSRNFADMLIQQSKNGVDIEILTTPSDNVGDESLRVDVEKIYEELRRNRIKLFLCSWEVGEPRLTTTSVSGSQAGGIGEKWYSLHFQLLINEKQALVTSRNLVDEMNLETYYLSSEPEFVQHASEEFVTAKNLFFAPMKVGETELPIGKVGNFLDATMLKDTLELYKKSGRLRAKHYFAGQIPSPELKRGIFICPFEGKLREFLYRFMDSAKTFLYFFLETFFDEDLIQRLEDKITACPDIKITVITRPSERIRQDPQKAKRMINKLLSMGVSVGYIPDIQGKFWISDNWLALSSGDFNRMNLGHEKGRNYWRADTQLIILDDDRERIGSAKKTFEGYFEPIDIARIYTREIESFFKGMSSRHKLQGGEEARNYISRLKASLTIKTERDVSNVFDLAVRLTKMCGQKKMQGIFVLMAIVLYYLQRRPQTLEELVAELKDVADESQMKNALSRLQFSNLIGEKDGVYRVNAKEVPHA